MANRNYNHRLVPGHKEVTISGSFAPDTAATPATATLKPSKTRHWSVAYVSTGLFRLTFNDNFVELISGQVSLQLAAGAARFITFGAYTAASKTIDVRITDAAGTVQNIAIDDNNRVNFAFTFSNSST